jgi:hypothetical protein
MNRTPWALPTKVKQPELDGDHHSLAFSVEFKASGAVFAPIFMPSCCAQTQIYLYLLFMFVFISDMLVRFVYTATLFMT